MNTTSNIILNKEVFANSIEEYKKKVKKVEETLHNISNIMKEIDGENSTWKSEAGVAIHQRFSNVEKKFDQINAELTVYEVFLTETLDSYTKEEDKQEKVVEQNVSYLDVNE